jgi:tetratricopeptide (TPR) repeat protein
MVTSTSSRSLEELAQMAQSGDPMAYIPYAEALRARGDYAVALDVCQRGVSQGPPTVAGRVLLARILFDMGKYEAAESECTAALDQATESISARKLMMQMAIKRHAYVKALDLIEALRTDLGDDPDLDGAFVEAQRGLRDRFAGDIALASAILRGEAGPPVGENGVLDQIRSRSEVIDAQVIPPQSDSEDWGEMITQWKELCLHASTSPIRLAILETSKVTALVRRLGIDQGTLVVTLRPEASFGAAKYLADQLASKSETVGGGLSE